MIPTALSVSTGSKVGQRPVIRRVLSLLRKLVEVACKAGVPGSPVCKRHHFRGW